MNIELLISYDTALPKRARDAYRMSFRDTHEAPCDLYQIGPHYQTYVQHRGVYADLATADRAAQAYMERD